MRLLQDNTAAAAAAVPSDPTASSVNSDMVFIFAALLFCFISVVVVGILARCGWLRRFNGSPAPLFPPPAKGLSNKALQSLPAVSFDAAAVAVEGRTLEQCAICLTDFTAGERIRILPPCGHGFHAACVDTWLRSQSSCPSCRRVLAVAQRPSRCRMCGTTADSVAEARRPENFSSFLP